jgi:hypothetical protein
MPKYLVKCRGQNNVEGETYGQYQPIQAVIGILWHVQTRQNIVICDQMSLFYCLMHQKWTI